MRGISKYKKTTVTTSDRMEILVMLYDGLLRFCREAKAGIEAGDPPVTGNAIGRAMAIIYQLSGSLDSSQDADFCDRLNALYAYANQRLLHANLRKDTQAIDEVVELMSGLREAWVEASQKLRSEQGAA